MGSGTSRREANAVRTVTATECGPAEEEGMVKSSGSKKAMSQRIDELEELVERQGRMINDMEQVLIGVQRDIPRTISVLQYNILAAYLGRNTQPWFLYGADVSAEARKQIFANYNKRDAHGRPFYTWPQYVEGILSPVDIQRVETEDENFKWSNRSVRLLDEIRRLDADVISLVELDHHGYFSDRLGDTYDSVFHKRPRQVSLDGCGVFWRRNKLWLVAQEGFDLVDDHDAGGQQRCDRSYLIVLLKWRCCNQQIVIVSTHLAKDPDNRAQTAIRVRQVRQIMEGLTDFTAEHKAMDAPVVLMGDLNARHFAEIRGLARTVWQIQGSPIHKFLWSASDVPTGATSITKARQCRIDVVQFLSSHLEVLEVVPVPKLNPGVVIPNAQHPSDHFPVCVRFRLKDDYQTQKEYARSWLECVAGREKLHPLTQAELDIAFEFFDRDRSNKIHRHDLEEACLDLRSNFHVDVQRLLLDCFPDNQISYTNFIRAYEARLTHERMRCIGELEYAFKFFAKDSSQIHIQKLEGAFREITPISFSDEEVRELVHQMGAKGSEDLVDLRSFCEVVCKATFPHKKQRQASKVRESLRRDSERHSRTCTKELALRLGRLNESLVTGSPITSPERRALQELHEEKLPVALH